MPRDEMFESSVRSAGDLAGVFEHDGEIGYFYLYDLRREQEQRIVGAIRVPSGSAAFAQGDIAVTWSQGEEFVGLFAKGVLLAAFEGDSFRKFGQGSLPGEIGIPAFILNLFK